MIGPDRRDYFRRLLGVMWLKPESALWYSHELFVARQLLGESFQSPSLEFGCMDGVNTFLLLGGEFDPAFDVYEEVRWDRASHHWKSLADDYFDTFDPERDTSRDVRTAPRERIDVGLSWKRAHVVKAARLGIYGRVVEQNPNEPLDQFAASEFATVWAPNLYWVEQLDQLLRELARILRPDGRIVTIFPDKQLLSHLWFRFAEATDPEWLKDLDRGRYGNAKRHARTLEEWEAVFARAGLRISRHEPFLPSIVAEVYDIGLRPMFPVMMDIHQTLRANAPADLPRIKEHWIELTDHFMSAMCRTDWPQRMGMPMLWHAFELTRAGE